MPFKNPGSQTIFEVKETCHQEQYKLTTTKVYTWLSNHTKVNQ